MIRNNVERGVSHEWYAKHSVGEYAALVCSGAMKFEDGLSLIRKSGQQYKITKKFCGYKPQN